MQKKDRVTVINAREKAPQKLTAGTYTGCGPYPKPDPGTHWIAVPGELRGYEKAHQIFGKLPWKSLFEPSIKLAERGFPIPNYLKLFVQHLREEILNSTLRSLFYHSDGSPLANVRYPQLAKTLRAIADEGPDVFYNGRIGQELIADIQKQTRSNSDSIITFKDLNQYAASVTEPLNISLGNYMMYTPPLPSKGAILSFILNVLKDFKFSAESMEGSQRMQTYHRIIEAFKFANGQLNKIIGPKAQSHISDLLSDQLAKLTQQRIDDEVHPRNYYTAEPQTPDKYATSHVSVIDRDGNAVSVTSSINHLFGSKIFSKSTGIILNNQLADFCGPNNTFPDIATVKGQQPPSSMSPSILISQDKTSMMVVGSSGGSMIVSATAQVIMNTLWFGLSMTDAIKKGRLYVNSNNIVNLEREFDKEVEKAMKEKHHEIGQPIRLQSVAQGIFRDHGCIEAVSDTRKQGKSAGY
ncbi:glutathione hydrolase 5 proenzyme-like isoform X2 [Scyliorhinus canicula]|uniref:glutathione hydrolase 5 proenzyme-like isoform X2 n=1 Tax=Scyliorhinus canicula TaxID=7830 RepID=UPI0018F5F73C|nr:glutathione hydrolase 5 proenzyme-like isoform X2 [Scyliorhinus canicula]